MVSDPPSSAHDSQEQRAVDAITAIFAGGDVADEALRLSNDFTDRTEGRLRAWLTRKSPLRR